MVREMSSVGYVHQGRNYVAAHATPPARLNIIAGMLRPRQGSNNVAGHAAPPARLNIVAGMLRPRPGRTASPACEASRPATQTTATTAREFPFSDHVATEFVLWKSTCSHCVWHTNSAQLRSCSSIKEQWRLQRKPHIAAAEATPRNYHACDASSPAKFFAQTTSGARLSVSILRSSISCDALYWRNACVEVN
jgi:hypothetical protein